MALAFDAIATAENSSGGTDVATIDLTTLTVSSGANRALVVGLCFSGDAPAGLTVTWDQGGTNQAMTAVVGAAENNTTCSAILYGLVAPTSGNKTCRASWTGNKTVFIDAVAYTGVDQTGGATTFAHGAANGNAFTGTASVTVTSAAGNAVVAFHSSNAQNATSLDNTTIFTSGNGANSNGAANRAAGAASVTLTATLNGSSDWASVGVDIVAATAATNIVLGSQVLDSGLSALDADASNICVCSAQPTTYAEAATSMLLGFKNFGAGAAFGAPAAGSPNGRKVTSVAVSDGTITTAGTVSAWAAIDTVNSRLLATGILTGGSSVLPGQSFTLGSFAIHLPSQ